MRSVFFCLLITALYNPLVLLAHQGHSHSSPSSVASQSKFGEMGSSIESPLTPSLKVRGGFEQGQYLGILPGFFSYFGDSEINLNLSYEYRYREFNSDQKNVVRDSENDHYIAATVKKAESDSLQFTLSGEYEENRASRLSRAINNFSYYAVGPSLIFKAGDIWTITGGYSYDFRRYPNGTYSIQLPRSSIVGESINPSAQDSQNAESEITRQNIEDAAHDVILAAAGNLGPNTVSFEGRQLISYSNFKPREFNGQRFKIGFDRSLWKNAGGQLSQSFETRKLSERRDSISVSELNLIQELGSKMSVSSLLRFNQTQAVSPSSWWEGYAQLQYIF